MSTANENRRNNLKAALRDKEVYLQAQKFPEGESDSLWLNPYEDSQLTKDPEPQDMKFHMPSNFLLFLPPALLIPLALITILFAASYSARVKNVSWSYKSVWGNRDDMGALLFITTCASLALFIGFTIEAFQKYGAVAGIALIAVFLALQVFGICYLWRKVITKLVAI